MKRLAGLWGQVVSFDNLLSAFRKARRGKRRKPAVAGFELNLERELLALQKELVTGEYQPGEYREFTIYERKPRLIAAAPFRDRVVHHALLDCIIDHSPDRASDDPLDYFPADDLFTPLERRAGIPIGNLTSQFLANLYLDAFDHFIKEALRVRPYLRYVDDMVVLGNDKGWLDDLRARIKERLDSERLRLHPRKAHVIPVQTGIDLLGYHVFPSHRLLRNDNGWRFVRKLKGFANAYADRRMDWADIDPSVQSWIGHACHADTEGLRKAIFSRIVFCRGGGQT
jgi:hypothetical protein